MRLMREVRCFVKPEAATGTVLNSWAGHPSSDGVAPFVVLRAIVEGPVDERSGFVCTISALDAMLRDVVGAHLRRRAGSRDADALGAAGALREVFGAAAAACPAPCSLAELLLSTSPFLRYAVRAGETDMIHMTQSFEFSAAHRLHCADLSDEENRRTFGKCNNPNGHGHNYVVEVTIRGTVDDATGRIIDHAHFQRTVGEIVIDRFDHKHLNLDCPEFATLNPTVENIARVVFKRLAGSLSPCELAMVRIWETPKTFAEYAGKT